MTPVFGLRVAQCASLNYEPLLECSEAMIKDTASFPNTGFQDPLQLILDRSGRRYVWNSADSLNLLKCGVILHETTYGADFEAVLNWQP